MKNQNDNQVQKRSIGSNVLIVILILIILATSAFGIFAWARYQTTVEGEGTAQVAQWNFKVTGDTTQTEQVVFAVTRDDGNTTVAEGMLAPGTSGKIEMAIDVTGTQTDLIYTISGSTEDMPRNLKLYSDAARTQEIIVVGQQFSKGNYLKLADIGTGEKIIPETIYWAWPFETGATKDDIDFNNKIDTEDMGKAMTMAIKVEGKQLNAAPVLADLVQVGDYVGYNASSNGEYTFTSENQLDGTTISGTISTNDTFNSAAKAQWRVLSVDKQTKKVELMSVEPTSQIVTLVGADGFKNAETVLNNISKIYSNGKGANVEAGRSIKVADLEQYSTYDKNQYKNTLINIMYGDTKFYNQTSNGKNQNFFTEIKDAEGNVIGYNDTLTEATQENAVEITQTYYIFNSANYIKNSKIYNMLFMSTTDETVAKPGYWLASRCTHLASDYCSFGVNTIHKKGLGSYGPYHSDGRINEVKYSVVPVVTLNDNIQTTGQVDGVWQLKVN